MKDNRIALLGAICGDIIGSAREFQPVKRVDFVLFPYGSRFTDDTVMTCAVAEWLMNQQGDLDSVMQKWGLKYSNAGYGGMFFRWIVSTNPKPYNSFGNGSAMRVSPVGWIANSLEETLELAKKTAEVTHNHPEGIKGAQAVAVAVFMARNGSTKSEIKQYIQQHFPGYNLDRDCKTIRQDYRFDVTCQGSVPESIIAFLESVDYESAVRLAVSLGGDADTMAAIAGSIAAAYYREIPDAIAGQSLSKLPPEIIDTTTTFAEKKES